MSARQKILSRVSLRRRIARAHSRGQRVVLTSGCYDVLHVGHVRGFEAARRHGDLLVVGVNRDQRVREIKGPGRPLVPERQRAEVIAGLEAVDYVVLFGEDDAGPLIRALRPDVVCKGGEYRGARIPEREAIEALEGRFVLLRQTPGVRSSKIIARGRG